MYSPNRALNQTETKPNSKPAARDQHRFTRVGDSYATNSAGQITSFRYRDKNMSYFFAYDEQGTLCGINSSTGWTWTRQVSSDARSWVIHNCFDRWEVKEEDAGVVFVNQTGIHATGKHAERMALPEIGLR